MSTAEQIEERQERQARWFQQYAVNTTNHALEQDFKRILIKMPTGVGKTFTAGLVFTDPHFRNLVNVKDRPLRVLWVAHRHRLLSQARNELAEFPGVELITQSAMSGVPEDLDWDLTVIDEAHHEAMMSLQLKLEQLADHPIIGLTATPDRPDGCLIKFDYEVEPITRKSAVKQGYLAQSKIRSIVDYRPTRRKHFSVIEILNTFHKEMGKTLVFMQTLAQAQEVHEFLRDELGYRSVFLHRQTPQEVDQILDEFSVGHHDFIINCNRIDEGIDVQGCTDVFIGRNYHSYVQLNQTIGRASRPDSECRIWEFVHPLKEHLMAINVVGTSDDHRLLYRRPGDKEWVTKEMPDTL